jgi:group I intron endonuclease
MIKISGVYGIQNLITGRIYVGSSQNVKTRLCAHKSLLQKTKTHHNFYLQNSWNKYGEKTFKFFLIEECGIEILYEREQYWFEYYKKHGLVYNQREIVESGRGMKRSEQACKNIGNAKRGKNHPMYGKHLSEETKKKISDANKNKNKTEETKKKISKTLIGTSLSEETKQKLKNRIPWNKGKKLGESSWNKDIPCREETKQKIREANLGKKLSEETKKKIGEAHSGKKPYVITEETRKKMSKSAKNREGGGMTGKKHSEESKKKMSDANKNNVRKRDSKGRFSSGKENT